MQKSQAQQNKSLLPMGEGARRADEGVSNNNPHPNPLPEGEGELRIALVHDFLTQYGGAEKVLEVLCEMFPEAPIYTLLHDQERMKGKFKDKEIHTSFLQKFPKFMRKRHGLLLPFIPTAPETFDLREFNLVISSSGAWSKGIVTKLNTIHIAYLHSPMRYVWDYNERYIREIQSSKFKVQSKLEIFFIRPILNYIRIWDRQAADRPDYLIANSKYTQERIRKYYRRESKIIYPPATPSLRSDVARRAGPPAINAQNDKYFLIVSRLIPYKKVDLAIEAFNKLELPLVVIGEGRQEKYLRKIAGENVKVLGWQNDDKISRYYAGARAFIFPAEDDFGITMVEAMSYGVPIVAYKKGGAMEVVQEGVTGEFFGAQTPEVLADGVRKFIKNEEKYDKEVIRQRAEKFSKEKFKNELIKYINYIINK
ncbi:GDP-mannose-dependent alpha-(1-6)-phosphatidylinositol monomannoside mannosyltransferase [bacterium BMS3Abin15]|nr:GDP-mannose-dependent alpha-(1-6)-phosphatidylinositol monomannoside mannosyltransferase [bacterium BMS3Abin15]HDZ85304.1 glycosyltransferase family 4 protein [Candidatus Moranbacteria bacterium]